MQKSPRAGRELGIFRGNEEVAMGAGMEPGVRAC